MNELKKAGSRQPGWAALPQPPGHIRKYELFQPIRGWIVVASRLRKVRLVRLTWHREGDDAPALEGHPERAAFIAEITRRYARQLVAVRDLGPYSFEDPGDFALLIKRAGRSLPRSQSINPLRVPA